MAWFRRPSRHTDEDFRQEMHEHLELLAEQLQAQGRPPDEAKRQARLAFGNPHSKIDQIRDNRWTRVADTFRRDVKTVVRGLVAARGFTAVVLAVLTLAMTALTTMFALVDGVMLRPLPFPDADRLVMVARQRGAQPPARHFADGDFLGLRERHDVFEGVAAITGMDVVLRRDSDRPAEFLRGHRVSAEFFGVLGVQPAIGRTFTTDNEVEGRHLVAVISHGFWQRRFGGDTEVLGRTLDTTSGVIEVIGVMPPGFEYPVATGSSTDLWIPYVIPPNQRVGRSSVMLRLIGRLRNDVSIEAAASAGLTESADAAVGPVSSHPGPIALMDLHYSQAHEYRSWMWMLLAAVGCVVTLAVVNIANLLAVRSTVRGREWALRVALGATRWDVARLLILESLILALAGATAGTLCGWLGMEALRPLLPANLPRIAGVAVDARTIAVTCSVAVALGLLAGLPPLWQARRGTRAALARDGRSVTTSRERLTLRGLLLTTEVALAVVLVLAGGMFLLSFARVSAVELGVDIRDVYVAHVRPGSQGLHHGTAESGLLRLEELRNRVESLPGVRSAALITENFPFAGSAVVWPVELPGQDTREALSARVGAVTPGYFATLGLRTTRGRLIDATDHVGSSSVVVLSEQAARVFFPGRDPVGETMDLGRTVRVVGVVTDVRDWGPESGVDVNGALVYVPLAQFPSPGAFMLVKATTGQGNVATTVNAAIRDAYPDMALVPVLPYSDYLRPFIVQRQFNMIVIGIFAALGLAVACIGVQGVTAYVVVQRTKEIGIRRALGGAVAAVIWSVLRATTAQVMTGVAIGVAVALYLGTFAGEFLFQTDPRDPWLYAAAGTLFLACALIAAVAPARRAARVDPATVLRLD